MPASACAAPVSRFDGALDRGRKVVANLNVRLYGDGTYEQQRLRVRLK